MWHLLVLRNVSRCLGFQNISLKSIKKENNSHFILAASWICLHMPLLLWGWRVSVQHIAKNTYSAVKNLLLCCHGAKGQHPLPSHPEPTRALLCSPDRKMHAHFSEFLCRVQGGWWQQAPSAKPQLSLMGCIHESGTKRHLPAPGRVVRHFLTLKQSAQVDSQTKQFAWWQIKHIHKYICWIL